MGVFSTGQLEATLVSEHQVNPGRAKRLVAAFVVKHGPIPDAYEGPGPEAWWLAWDLEIEHPLSMKRRKKRAVQLERQVARRENLVDRLAQRRRDLDPGPVAPSKRAAADWVRTNAIRGPVWHQIKGYSRKGSVELFDRFVRELDDLELAGGPEPLRQILNNMASYFHKPGFPVAFHVPWMMRTPPQVPADWIGTIEARACIDQLVLSSHPYTTRGRVVSGQRDEFRTFGLDCPTERGGPRENDDSDARYMNADIRSKRGFIARAAAAWDTDNDFEAGEIRVCSTDLTVVAFTPMRNWRRVLKPRAIRR